MLMPYGAKRYARLVTKVGNVKAKVPMMPYGAARHVAMAAKVGVNKVEETPVATPTRHVTRRNRRA